MVYYNSVDKGLKYYNGTAWNTMGGGKGEIIVKELNFPLDGSWGDQNGDSEWEMYDNSSGSNIDWDVCSLAREEWDINNPNAKYEGGCSVWKIVNTWHFKLWLDNTSGGITSDNDVQLKCSAVCWRFK